MVGPGIQYRTKEGDEQPPVACESLTTARWAARRLLIEEKAVLVRIVSGDRMIEEWSQAEDGPYRGVTG